MSTFHDDPYRDQADAFEAIAKQIEHLIHECRINIKEFNEPLGDGTHGGDYKFQDCIGALSDVISDCNYQTNRLMVEAYIWDERQRKRRAS